MGARIEISVEKDPTPLVLGLTADIRSLLEDRGFAERTAGLDGVAAIRTAGGETATVRLGDDRVAVEHGFDGAADIRVIANSDMQGQEDHPELLAWVREVLEPSGRDWRAAAERFWSVLERMPGAPEALLVVETGGDEQRFGSAAGRAYEIHGAADDLEGVLSGRLPLLDAAFEGRAYLRGTFPEISVLSGAGHAIRHGGAANG